MGGGLSLKGPKSGGGSELCWGSNDMQAQKKYRNHVTTLKGIQNIVTCYYQFTITYNLKL